MTRGLVLAVLPFLACSAGKARLDVDGAATDAGSAVPSSSAGGSGAAGAGGRPPIAVVTTQPCWVMGCDSGYVCDGESCVEPPTACPPGGDPACGLDGRTYDSVCAANLVGVGVTPSQRQCGLPPGYYFCGQRFCSATTSFCNDPMDYTERSRTPAENLGCLPLPSACVGDRTCSCMYDHQPFELDSCCSASANGEVYFGCSGEVP